MFSIFSPNCKKCFIIPSNILRDGSLPFREDLLCVLVCMYTSSVGYRSLLKLFLPVNPVYDALPEFVNLEIHFGSK